MYQDRGEVDDLVIVTLWPETSSDGWCGEHPDFPAYLASLKGTKPND